MKHPSGELPAALKLAARRDLYDIVARLAGAHFREIQRASGLSFGPAAYHLAYLKKHHLIKEERDGNNIRYFPVNIATHDEKLLMLLRQGSVRNILIFIFSHEGCSHQEIVSSVHLSPSTTTWHLRKLLADGVVQEKKRGKYKAYFLGIPKERIMKLLIAHKEGFVDALVDGLIEMWDQP